MATAIALPVALLVGLVAARVTADRPVPVKNPPNSALSARLCSDLTGALPRRLAELDARIVDGDKRLTAAWGDPPVTLRCGIIATPSPLGQLVTLDGIDWTTVIGKSTVTWLTVGRRATVEVTVPRRYDAQGPMLAQLSPAISRRVPVA